MSKTVRFRKMNGLGNDFVVLDVRAHALALKAAQIALSPTGSAALAAIR